MVLHGICHAYSTCLKPCESPPLKVIKQPAFWHGLHCTDYIAGHWQLFTRRLKRSAALSFLAAISCALEALRWGE